MSKILQQTQDEQPPVLQRHYKHSFELLCAVQHECTQAILPKGQRCLRLISKI